MHNLPFPGFIFSCLSIIAAHMRLSCICSVNNGRLPDQQSRWADCFVSEAFCFSDLVPGVHRCHPGLQGSQTCGTAQGDPLSLQSLVQVCFVLKLILKSINLAQGPPSQAAGQADNLSGQHRPPRPRPPAGLHVRGGGEGGQDPPLHLHGGRQHPHD